MGAKQSFPKITAQDRAILEYDLYAFPWFLNDFRPLIVCSLKLQRDKLRQYQKTVRYESFLFWKTCHSRTLWK